MRLGEACEALPAKRCEERLQIAAVAPNLRGEWLSGAAGRYMSI